MALDKNYVVLDDALKIAAKYYNKKTLVHAKRVLYFIMDSKTIPARIKTDCYCLAVMHDLLEDTDYDPKDLPPNFKKALELITKPEDLSYDEYCLKIHNRAKQDYGLCAWFVKLADMKDHLSQIDTLTSRLKEKYLRGLRYLL